MEIAGFILTILWRYATGHHLDGKWRTDAGWFARSTKVIHPAGRASWWAHTPRAHRAGYRHGAHVVIGGMVWLYLFFQVGFILAAVALATGGGWLVRRWLHVRKHRKHVERPTMAALAAFLGVHHRSVALTVRPGVADAASGEHLAALSLPDHYAGTAEQKRTVEEIMRGHLGVDIKAQWRLDTHPKRLTICRAPTPPRMVALAEVLAELDGRPDNRIYLGRDSEGKSLWWDTTLEDPHVAVHGGSRRGKTSLLLSTASQELSRGSEVTAIDPKRLGLLALSGVPGFTLVSDPRQPAAMWEAVADFAAECDWRYEQLTKDPTLEFPRKLLLLDEVSMLSGVWAKHWAKIKTKGQQALPPVWDDVSTAVWTGAQCHCHVWVAGQRLDYKILGGMLGNFGYRMLAGYTPQDYARLIGQTPVLRSQKHRGRFLVYAGDDPEWTQLVFGEPDEWREYALSRQASEVSRVAADLGRNLGHGTLDMVGLEAAAAHLGLSREAFSKRMSRQGRPGGEYRVSNRPAWPAAELTAWLPAKELTP